MTRKIEYKKLLTGIKIPALGLGTWKMGRVLTVDKSSDQTYISAIKRAIHLGLVHIDTAELYGHGHAELLVGKAIKSTNRKNLFITTKISPHHLFTSGQIKRHLEASLVRLDTSYVDLYLVHWPNPAVPIKRIMKSFDKLVEEKLTRFIGVSNFSLNQLKAARNWALHPIVTNQVEYNLLNRQAEKDLLPFCQKHQIILTAYSPLAQGQIVNGRFKILDSIAEKYQKTAVQVAIRWLLDKPNVITIPKATSKSHLLEIYQSLGWHLGKKDQDIIGQAFS